MKTVEMELKELILDKYGSLSEFCKKIDLCTAGSGGRTRIRAACIRTYSGIVPNHIPNQ